MRNFEYIYHGGFSSLFGVGLVPRNRGENMYCCIEDFVYMRVFSENLCTWE